MVSPEYCLILILLSQFSGCGSSGGPGSPTTIPAPPPPPSSTTPRLGPGPHFGYIVGFDALDAQQTALVDSLLSQAVAAGPDFTGIQFGWEDLESAPGVFETGDVMLALDGAAASQQPIFQSLSTLDSASLTLPADLMSADRSTTATGLALGGPEIQARFRVFLDWLIPELAD